MKAYEQKYEVFDEQFSSLKKKSESELCLECLEIEYNLLNDILESILITVNNLPKPSKDGTISFSRKFNTFMKCFNNYMYFFHTYFDEKQMSLIKERADKVKCFINGKNKSKINSTNIKQLANDGEVLLRKLYNNYQKFFEHREEVMLVCDKLLENQNDSNKSFSNKSKQKNNKTIEQQEETYYEFKDGYFLLSELNNGENINLFGKIDVNVLTTFDDLKETLVCDLKDEIDSNLIRNISNCESLSKIVEFILSLRDIKTTRGSHITDIGPYSLIEFIWKNALIINFVLVSETPFNGFLKYALGCPEGKDIIFYEENNNLYAIGIGFIN